MLDRIVIIGITKDTHDNTISISYYGHPRIRGAPLESRFLKMTLSIGIGSILVPRKHGLRLRILRFLRSARTVGGHHMHNRPRADLRNLRILRRRLRFHAS